MKRLAVLGYGVFAYVMFLASFLYLIGFVGNMSVPKDLDSGASIGGWAGVVIDMLLIILFGVQHTVMARPSFKAWVTRFIPQAIERSTFVLVTSWILFLMFWAWQPFPKEVWNVSGTMLGNVLLAVFFLGWVIVLYSSFLINHFDLFGLRQVVLYFQGKEYSQVHFKLSGLYKLVRHPLMLGMLIAFWATPVMTLGHLLFAVKFTLYIFIGVHFEERTLVALHGKVYRDYQSKTPMLIPFLLVQTRV